MQVSECCGAMPLGEAYMELNGELMGLCSNCLENTEFYNEEEEEEIK